MQRKQHVRNALGCLTYENEKNEKSQQNQWISHFSWLYSLRSVRFFFVHSVWMCACECLCTPVYLQNVSEAWILCSLISMLLFFFHTTNTKSTSVWKCYPPQCYSEYAQNNFGDWEPAQYKYTFNSHMHTCIFMCLCVCAVTVRWKLYTHRHTQALRGGESIWNRAN